MWGGAQWVLVSWWVFITLFQFAGRCAGFNKRSNFDFGIWYFTEIVEKCSLALLLWWGGFWS